MGWMGYNFGFMMQNEKDGALSLLFAANDPSDKGESHNQFQRFMEVKKREGLAFVPPAAKDALTASRLWEECERVMNGPIVMQY